MKRSEINRARREREAMCEKYRCYLPPFCRFTPEEWKTKGHEYDEVRECMLGWDITDYGLGNFDKIGFSLITIRNGSRKQPEKYTKVYAEKLLFLKEGQYSPNHFHWFKTEDIINRGGERVRKRIPPASIRPPCSCGRTVSSRIASFRRNADSPHPGREHFHLSAAVS